MSKCEACDDKFKWDDTVVIVNDTLYHADCLDLYPTGFYAMLDDNPLGETENDDGQMAYELIDGLLEDD